jgi:uncharacterized membrane protein YadS
MTDDGCRRRPSHDTHAPASRWRSRAWLLTGLALSGSPWASPPVALALGLTYGLLGLEGGLAGAGISPASVRRWTTTLLQLSIVALGFGFDLQAVMRAGERGLLYTAAGIAGALLLGHVLARLLRVSATPALLIAVGTAICGGSAIAAVGPAIEANDEDLSVALGTVFILNAVALFLFPLVGAWFALSESQFGMWAALAIHDTSSVVGAGMRYGPIALTTATTVKLARALWIVPVTVAAASLRMRSTHHPGADFASGGLADGASPDGGLTHGSLTRGSRARLALPWFILGFLGAAALAHVAPVGAPVYAVAARLGTLGLSAALFLVGTQLSPESLRRVGWRALALGLLLWIIVASLSLWLVKTRVISL